uniref:Choline kinase N-terminal domain-containing protein n=6 Tax=Triticinae TaxID=1648030 RepID=A0A452ZNU1_AEGTS
PRTTRARARSTRIPHSHFRTRTEDSLRPRVDMVAIEGQSLAETAAVAAPAPAGLPKEARGLLHELAAEWADVADCRALEVVPLKGAMTNEVYQVRWLTGGGEEKGEGEYRKVLMRVYGEGVEVFFDREDEVRTFECMSRHGHGPRLLGRFPTGRVEEFIHARTLSAVDLRDPEIAAIIASKLREFHHLDMPGPKRVLMWDRLRNWLKTAKSVCPSDEAKEFRLDNLEKEINALESEFSGEDQCIGFCHNDLQYGNIMIDEETKALTIIDYEYASFNPIAFDISNHFCEMAADYHSEEPHILDYTKYPDLDERKRFVQTYLSSSGEEPDAEKIKDLMNNIEKYTLASHLVWGLWGIISEHVNDIDFDYMEYARQRLAQYWLKKPEILSCRVDDE